MTDWTRAIDAIASNQYAEAIDLCTQAILANPGLLTAYWYLGLAQLLQGDEAEAQATWMSAMTTIDFQQADEAIADLLGILLTEAEQQTRKPYVQERLYVQALEITPDPSVICLRLGKAIAAQGRLDEAIDLWQQAVRARPEWADPYLELANLWQQLGQFSEAIEAYGRLLKLRSKSEDLWQIHYHLGLCLGRVGKRQEAIEQFQYTLNLKPDFAAAWGDLGSALLQQELQQESMHPSAWQEGVDCFFAAVCQHSNFAQQYCDWATTLSPEHSRSQGNAQFLRLLQSHSAPAEILQSLRSLTRSSDSAAPASSSPPACRPSGYYETAEAAVRFGEVTAYQSIDPPGVLPLTPPRSLDGSIHLSFRFGRAVPMPETFVVEIPQGQFWLNANESSSAILTAAGKLVGNLSPEFPLLSPGHPDKHPSRHSLLHPSSFHQGISQARSQTIHRVEGTIAVLSGLTNGMYFHWMFDVLPRLDLLRRSGIDWNQIDGFVVSHDLPFQQETLQLLGVPASKILDTQNYSQIQADRLIVPSFPAVPAWMPPWVCAFLRSSFLRSDDLMKSWGKGKRGDRLYISRRLTANRRVINEAEITEFLSRLGFQTVTLESLSVLEQAALLANAEAVISPHGGGLTNLVFCRPGTKAIEFFSPKYVYPCYWLVSNCVNLEYYYLLGKVPEGEFLHHLFYPNPRLEDIVVDVEELKQLLHQADIT